MRGTQAGARLDDRFVQRPLVGALGQQASDWSVGQGDRFLQRLGPGRSARYPTRTAIGGDRGERARTFQHDPIPMGAAGTRALVFIRSDAWSGPPPTPVKFFSREAPAKSVANRRSQRESGRRRHFRQDRRGGIEQFAARHALSAAHIEHRLADRARCARRPPDGRRPCSASSQASGRAGDAAFARRSGRSPRPTAGVSGAITVDARLRQRRRRRRRTRPHRLPGPSRSGPSRASTAAA